MIYVGCALVTALLGWLPLFSLLIDRSNRNQSQQLHQSWKRKTLLCMLFALELSVLIQVAVFLFLTLVEFGVIDSSAEGMWHAFIGYLFFVTPYMIVATSLLFAFVMSLAFLWRKKRDRAK